MDTTHLQHLLTHTSLITRRHQEIARASGSDFNLFSILGVGHLEVSTHSALLGDLLNPRGSHGQGKAFLEKFLDLIAHSAPQLDPDTTEVFLEYHIGSVTNDSGGRIDILLRDQSKKQIAIENKIYAGEQPNWIRRYQNFLSEFSDESELYYLTLDRQEPQDGSDADKKSVECLTYGEDIIQWLFECRKEATETPIVRESITQYVHLIQSLTGQNPNQKMNEEIINLALKDRGNLEATLRIAQSESSIYQGLVDKLKEPLSNYQGIYFNHPLLLDNGLNITLQFGGPRLKDCSFGFAFSEKTTELGASEGFVKLLHQKFQSKFLSDYEINEWWVGSFSWAEYPDWGLDVFEDIISGDNSFATKINDQVKSLVEIIPIEAEVAQLPHPQP